MGETNGELHLPDEAAQDVHKDADEEMKDRRDKRFETAFGQTFHLQWNKEKPGLGLQSEGYYPDQSVYFSDFLESLTSEEELQNTRQSLKMDKVGEEAIESMLAPHERRVRLWNDLDQLRASRVLDSYPHVLLKIDTAAKLNLILQATREINYQIHDANRMLRPEDFVAAAERLMTGGEEQFERDWNELYSDRGSFGGWDTLSHRYGNVDASRLVEGDRKFVRRVYAASCLKHYTQGIFEELRAMFGLNENKNQDALI